MPIRLVKPWKLLTEENLASVKGHMGVYQLGSETAGVTFIGCADARSLFGLKGELLRHCAAGGGPAFRYEVTTAYTTRYRELLMVFFADHGVYPRDNPVAGLPRLGRLSPG